MTYLLTIESSSKNCSVSIFNKNILLECNEEYNQQFSHSEKLTVLINKVINSNSLSFNNLKAIAVGSGPGSYTGLRIGTSVAKGMCYALNIPLISVSTLESMFLGIKKKQFHLYCPMIDAKRMEVYSALFDSKKNIVRDIEVENLTSNSYKIFSEKKVLFFGDGSKKCIDIFNNDNWHYETNFNPSSRFMGEIVYKKFLEKNFENLENYEPFYLKDFKLKKK